MRRLWLFLLGQALTLHIVIAQQVFLSGPVEALAYDAPTHSFRAVIGLPGSAMFGPAIADGFDSGSVAPRKSYAIGFQQDVGILVTGLDSSVSTTPITGLSQQPHAITWSADGSVAILYSKTDHWIQVLRGLPDAPQADAPMDVSTLGGSLAAVAIDPVGKTVALAIQGDNGGAFLLTGDQSFVSVFPTARPLALAFSVDGSNLYVLDGATSQLAILGVNDWSVQTLPLDGLQDPFAIGSGLDAQKREVLWVASGTDCILRELDKATLETLLDLPLDFEPTGIQAFGRTSFVIATRSRPEDPLWLLSNSPRPAAYFVPAAPAAGGLE
jgi:hypothetical protein